MGRVARGDQINSIMLGTEKNRSRDYDPNLRLGNVLLYQGIHVLNLRVEVNENTNRNDKD